jgi:hypothetical protein
MKRKYIFSVPLLFSVFFIISFKTISAQIVINEMGVLDSPDWIELYAYEDVDISGWYLDDEATESKLYTFPSETIVGPSTNPFKTINVSDRLNNGGDIIKLFKTDGTLVEEVRYGDKGGVCLPDSSNGSVGKTTDGGNYTERYSVKSYNDSNLNGTRYDCPSPTPVPTNTPAPTDTPTPTNTPIPTSTSKPTATPTKKPTPTPRDNTAQNELLQKQSDISNFRYSSDEDKSNAEDVLGASKDEETQKENISPFAYVLFGLGIIFIGVSAYLFVKHRKQSP